MKKKDHVQEVVIVRRIRFTEKVCAVCQRRFMGMKKSLYCGRVCQQKASYRRHAAERRSARMAKYYRSKEQP